MPPLPHIVRVETTTAEGQLYTMHLSVWAESARLAEVQVQRELPTAKVECIDVIKSNVAFDGLRVSGGKGKGSHSETQKLNASLSMRRCWAAKKAQGS